MRTRPASGIIQAMPLRVFLVLLTLALPVPSHATVPATPDWYAIEIIVFAHREDASGQDEVWPADPGVPDLAGAAETVPPTVPPSLQAYESLPSDALRMSGALRRLERSGRYRPLLHFGWLQPGVGRDVALPVTVSVAATAAVEAVPLRVELPEPPPTESPISDEPAADVEDEMDPFELPPDTEALAAELGAEYAEPPVRDPVIGTARLVQQRFLHVELDLLFISDEPLPIPEDGDWYERRDRILRDLSFGTIGYDEARARLDALNAEPRFQRYRLRESRRIRTDEVHYFDHPEFGAIVTVRPLGPEAVEARRKSYEEALQRALRERAMGAPVNRSGEAGPR